MVERKYPTEEQRWCGQWFDCPVPGCKDSMLAPSKALIASLEAQRKAVAS